MKYPITLSGSTPYFERHFLLCPDSPEAYVSAFRESLDESRRKRIGEAVVWGILNLSALALWLAGLAHVIWFLAALGGAICMLSWRNRHEKALLGRTFDLAIEGKDASFQAYLWRYCDLRLIRD